MPRPPSLRLLAQAANVSVATASRAVSGDLRTAEATRRHVLTVAAKIGYQRNALASSVMRDFKRGHATKLREVIAYLCWAPQRDWGAPELEFYSRMFRGVEQRTTELGADVVITWLRDPDVPLPRLGAILRARGVRGLILAPVPDVVHLPEFPWGQFAAVAIGNMLATPRLHRLQTEHGENVAICIAELEKRGAVRIGYIGERKVDRRLGHLAVSRFLFHHHSLPQNRRVPPFLWDEWDADDFAAWLDRHRPDAIISHDIRPQAILQRPRHRRIQFCLVAAQLNYPGISGALPRHETLGAKAVDLVLAAIAHHDYGPPSEPMNLYIPGEWRDAGG